MASVLAGDPRVHPDGLRSWVDPRPASPVVRVATAFAVGQVDDPVGQEGLAHFVEHLWFEATVDAERVSHHYQRLGCAWNAYTSADQMMFVTMCPRDVVGSVLALEAARLEAWEVEEALIPREWSVVTHELAWRGDDAERREFELVARQILPLNHPFRARASRPALAPAPPSGEVVEAFRAQWLRPERAATVVSDGVDPAQVEALLDTTFGKGKPLEARTAVRAPPAVPRTLRLAPVVLTGQSTRPMVYLAVAPPPIEGFDQRILGAYVRDAMLGAFGGDPRVLGLECGGAELVSSRFLLCGLEVVDDAAARTLGADLPGRLEFLREGDPGRWLKDEVHWQGQVASLVAREAPDVSPDAWPVGLASYLLEASQGRARSVPLRRYLAEAGLAESALVLVLVGTRPVAPLAAPLVFDLPAPRRRAPADVAPLPLLKAEGRTLANGLSFAVVHRPDVVLAYAHLLARPEEGAAALGAALGGVTPGWGVPGVGEAWGPARELDLQTVPPTASQLLVYAQHLLALPTFTPTRLAASVARWRTASDRAWSSAGSAARALLRASLGGVLPPLAEVEGLAEEQILRTRVYDPGRTRVALVAPLEEGRLSDLGLEGLAHVARDAPPARPPLPPELVLYEAPGEHAHLGGACRPGVRGARLATLARAWEERLMVELRERRGLVYGVSVRALGDQLAWATSTAPGLVAQVHARLSDTVPSAADVAEARAYVVTLDAPGALPAAELARRLAYGLLTPEDLAGWLGEAELADPGPVIAACRATARTFVAGPSGTALPAGGRMLTRAEAAAITSGW